MLGKSVRGGIQVVPVVRIGRRTVDQFMVRWRPRHFQGFGSPPGTQPQADGPIPPDFWGRRAGGRRLLEVAWDGRAGRTHGRMKSGGYAPEA